MQTMETMETTMGSVETMASGLAQETMGSGLANELDLTFGDFARGDADAAQQHLGRLKPLQSANASDAIPLKELWGQVLPELWGQVLPMNFSDHFQIEIHPDR
jgi:hypothetical protein